MNTKSPIGIWDTACVTYARATREPKATPLYPSAFPQGFISVGAFQQQNYLTSMLRKPQRLIKFTGVPAPATSVIENLEYPIKGPTSRIFEISRDAEDFISKQKKSIQFRGDLFKISDRISEFLEKRRIQARVSIDLFTDPEYHDWTETMIKIGTREKQMKRMYALYDELLRYSLEGIRKRSLKKLAVAIERIQ